MLNTLRVPVGNRMKIRIRIRILHVVQSADPQFRIIPIAWYLPHHLTMNAGFVQILEKYGKSWNLI